jgi:hypothetical protein
MSNVTPIQPPPTPPSAKRLTPDEAQTLVRRARDIVNGVRVCIDHEEDVSAYALDAAQEMLTAVDDALEFMAPKRSSSEEVQS